MSNEGLTFSSNPQDGETVEYSFQHTGGEASSEIVKRVWSRNEWRDAWVANVTTFDDTIIPRAGRILSSTKEESGVAQWTYEISPVDYKSGGWQVKGNNVLAKNLLEYTNTSLTAYGMPVTGDGVTLLDQGYGTLKMHPVPNGMVVKFIEKKDNYFFSVMNPVIGSCFYPKPSPSPTPSITPSVTPTPTPSVTPSVTPSITPSVTPSRSPGGPIVTPGPTPSKTPKPSRSPDPSLTPTPSATTSPSVTSSPSLTPTPTPSPTPSKSPSPSPSPSPSESPSPSPPPSPCPSPPPSPEPPPSCVLCVYTTFESECDCSLDYPDSDYDCSTAYCIPNQPGEERNGCPEHGQVFFNRCGGEVVSCTVGNCNNQPGEPCIPLKQTLSEGLDFLITETPQPNCGDSGGGSTLDTAEPCCGRFLYAAPGCLECDPYYFANCNCIQP